MSLLTTATNPSKFQLSSSEHMKKKAPKPSAYPLPVVKLIRTKKLDPNTPFVAGQPNYLPDHEALAEVLTVNINSGTMRVRWLIDPCTYGGTDYPATEFFKQFRIASNDPQN